MERALGAAPFGCKGAGFDFLSSSHQFQTRAPIPQQANDLEFN